MNVLIIGGAGFVGANLVRACLREAGTRVTVLDSLEPRLSASKDNLRDVMDLVRFVHGDMRDAAALGEVIPAQEVIFNCAGQTSHPISMKEPVFDAGINCLGNLALLEAVRTMNREAVVVYTSTSTVVGKAVTSPIDESHPELPLDIYSANKLAAEKYYRIYNTAHGLKTIALRFPNLYGPFGKGFPEFGFINYFIHLARTGDEIKIYGRGDQTRNLLYVDDACTAMLRAARAPSLYGDRVFVAHDVHVSVREIAEEIIATFGRGKLTHIEWPEDRKRIEVDDVQLSTSKFRDHVTWPSPRTLRQGLEETKRILEDQRAQS